MNQYNNLVRKPLVYVAGPYTYPDPEENVKRAIKVANRLMTSNVFTPFVPHLNFLWDLYSPGLYGYDDWLGWCCQHLIRCDVVLRYPGESRGADIETDTVAAQHGIPVVRSGIQDPVAVLTASDWWQNYSLNTPEERKAQEQDLWQQS